MPSCRISWRNADSMSPAEREVLNWTPKTVVEKLRQLLSTIPPEHMELFINTQPTGRNLLEIGPNFEPTCGFPVGLALTLGSFVQRVKTKKR